MAKMTKTQLIDAIAELSNLSKNDVKTVIEHLATVGYKELNESGEFRHPGLCQNVRGQQARDRSPKRHQSFHQGADGVRREARQPERQASPLKVAKDAVA